MSKVLDIFGFVQKYALEALSVAEALNSVLSGIALPSEEAAKVKNTIDQLQAAAENLGKIKPPVPVKISAKDIEVAVAKVLPGLLNDAVTKAVMEALANEAAKNVEEKSS